MSTFGENLRELRKSRGYTQERFAELINSNQASVTAWERNTRMPSLATIQGIADVFHVPLSSLIGVQNTGHEDDLNMELLDLIKSKPQIRMILDRLRYLSDAEIRLVLDVVKTLTKEVYSE